MGIERVEGGEKEREREREREREGGSKVERDREKRGKRVGIRPSCHSFLPPSFLPWERIELPGETQ